MKLPFRFTRVHAWLLALVSTTLVLSIVFDQPHFATLVFPALWAATLGAPRCRSVAAHAR